MLGRRGCAVESADRARVTTNVMMRDLDFFFPRGADGRRLEVVADGLPLFEGAQLAVDTTLVCPLHRARVTTNVMMRDLDFFFPRGADGRRLEVVADGLPLFEGAQLAVDTTLVCPLHCDGSARPGASSRDGALITARRKKERVCPELIGPHGRVRLVVLAGEVGGRWSDETRSFISQLAKAKSRAEPFLLRRRMEQVWRLRWGAILSCAARAFASSLLDRRTALGSDGATPLSHEVEGDFRHSGSGP